MPGCDRLKSGAREEGLRGLKIPAIAIAIAAIAILHFLLFVPSVPSFKVQLI